MVFKYQITKNQYKAGNICLANLISIHAFENQCEIFKNKTNGSISKMEINTILISIDGSISKMQCEIKSLKPQKYEGGKASLKL